MNVALLGFDVEGRASYEYFESRGESITVCDQNPKLSVPDGAESQLGDNYLDNLDRFDLLVRTPGLHPHDILAKNPTVGQKITTGTNEFFRACATRNIIGVTGTKGKGTTSTLIAKLLEASGKKVFLGGNIGVPALSFLADVSQDDWVVLELSNFQLIDLQYSPHYAVCLMIVPEHLNWHPDMAEYMQAKSNLFAHQSAEDIAIYFGSDDDSLAIASAGQGQKIPFGTPPGAAVDNGIVSIDGQPVVRTDELKLLGAHNQQNVCAAITAVWQALGSETAHPESLIQSMHEVLTNFSGLPHRLELVREVAGVRFYNDSFSSGLHSTEAALLAISGPKVVILGGFERMLPFEHFVEFSLQHKADVGHYLIIGASGERLAGELQQAGFENLTLDTSLKTMNQVVGRARSIAKPGDSIVLSPGFASFDMFKNFEERGNRFRDVVNGL
jgi:UDP-N-acetylmuramoylalanine--D-glutamate ligase